MARQLIWSPTARLDLRNIFDYIAQNDVSAAREFVSSIVEAVERLRTFPECGRVVPEFEEPTLREVFRKSYRIVYRLRVEREIIEIVRVWHAARGTPRI